MNDSEDPKIIVDDDWKEQVQREKEQVEESSNPDSQTQKIPDASFSMLVTSLATQAIAAMGYLPMAGEQNPHVDRGLAKHLIDSLSVLQEKTKGNLSNEEAELLSESLHQLRMSFVAERPATGGADDENKESSIVIP